LRLDLRHLWASVEVGKDDALVLVLTDGVVRVELTGPPQEPKSNRVGMERIVEAISQYHARLPPADTAP
jgi:hypothetical protein